nr:probable indole-3-pyruvate monooxygenase YUCCA3 [Ipomoea batatas]
MRVLANQDGAGDCCVSEYICRWLVAASGENVEKFTPKFEAIRVFGGPVMHACEYKLERIMKGNVFCADLFMESRAVLRDQPPEVTRYRFNFFSDNSGYGMVLNIFVLLGLRFNILRNFFMSSWFLCSSIRFGGVYVIFLNTTPRGEGVKQKNVSADDRNRKAPRDIGNLRNAPLDQIGRPITRGFCAQHKIMAKASAPRNNRINKSWRLMQQNSGNELANLRNAPLDQIGRPITRGFCAQHKIMAKASAPRNNRINKSWRLMQQNSGNELAVLDYVKISTNSTSSHRFLQKLALSIVVEDTSNRGMNN